MRTSHGQLPALQRNEDQDVTELLSLLTRIVDQSRPGCGGRAILHLGLCPRQLWRRL